MAKDHLISLQGCGILYIVATPIGNMDDITVRALKILSQVDLILAENASHTLKLCSHYGIKTPVTTYNQHNSKKKSKSIISKLESGSKIGLLTDAGTPGISDPGSGLVREAAEKDIKIVPLPGPSAVVTALSIAGFPAEQFIFMGFPSSKKGKRLMELENLRYERRTAVLFEAPHRLKRMLADLKVIIEKRHMVVVREVTKIFEEIIRGTAEEICDFFETREPKGEFTIVVEGYTGEAHSAYTEKGINEILDSVLKKHPLISTRDAAKLISSESKIPYRQIYKLLIEK